MQYIECIHCHKRYPANKKLRASIGKKVRCTECWKSFPIIVYEVKADDTDRDGLVSDEQEA